MKSEDNLHACGCKFIWFQTFDAQLNLENSLEVTN